MITVRKYQLEIKDVQVLSLPKTCQALHVGEQFGDLFLWVHGDFLEEQEQKRIAIVGTGNPAPALNRSVHLGTVMMRGGALVWHIFQEIPA